MRQFIVVALIAVIVAAEARYRHPFSVEDVRTLFPSDDEYGTFGEHLTSGNPMLYGGNHPKVSASRRQMLNNNIEVKKNDPIMSRLLEEASADNSQEENSEANDYFNYSIKNKMRKTQALNKLYEEIATKFPFLVKQGLFESGGGLPSLDHLLSMTVFSQPKMGKK